MSQKLIFELLQESGTKTSLAEIKQKIEKNHPDRSLKQYVSTRLKSLEKKGFIIRHEDSNEITWEVSKNPPSLSCIKLDEIDTTTKRANLTDFGIDIKNIVAILNLGIEVRLRKINEFLSNTTFEPEMMTPLIIDQTTDREATFLLYSTGRVTILGVDTKIKLQSNIGWLLKRLEDMGYNPESNFNDAEIKNIHAIGELDQEIELEKLSVHLGLENVEYDPTHFSGLIYRIKGSTIMIFRTGKFAIMGDKSYSEVLDTTRNLVNDMPEGITIAQDISE